MDIVVLDNPNPNLTDVIVLDPVSYRFKENTSSTIIGNVLDDDDGMVVDDGMVDIR